jgi:hypothetical protein
VSHEGQTLRLARATPLLPWLSKHPRLNKDELIQRSFLNQNYI